MEQLRQNKEKEEDEKLAEIIELPKRKEQQEELIDEEGKMGEIIQGPGSRRETPQERVALIADAKEAANAAYAAAEVNEEEGEKKRLRFVENYQTFKRCEACGGSGKRLFIFRCLVCKGLGSVVATSATKTGYHEVGGGRKEN